MRGRPRKRFRRGYTLVLSQNLIRQFTILLGQGLPVDGACDYLGVSPSRYMEWRRRGEIYLDGEGSPREWAIYGEFVIETRRALAAYRLEQIRRLHNPKNDQWRQQLAVLERRDRPNFGKYEPVGETTPDEFDRDERFL